jgi:hypothetical protein
MKKLAIRMFILAALCGTYAYTSHAMAKAAGTPQKPFCCGDCTGDGPCCCGNNGCNADPNGCHAY